MRWLLLKDLQILRRSPLLVALLVIYPIVIAVLFGLARDGGTTVVYSTHNVAEAERFADRLLVLADGELLFTGTPSQLERATGGGSAGP